MRTILYLMLLQVFLISLDSCRKKNEAQPPESQGTHFDHLLKCVTYFTNVDKLVTEYYTYNSAGDLTELKDVTQTSAGSDLFSSTYYRNAGGMADSIVYSGKRADTFYYQNKALLHYDLNNKLVYSISLDYSPKTGSLNSKDSSVYVYSGNKPEHRDDYISFPASTYTGTRQLFYQFDNAGNMTSVRIQINTGANDEFHFTYDGKVNPLHDCRTLYFTFAPLFFRDYMSVNNITSIDYGNRSDDQNFQYIYSENNKPLNRKMFINNSSPLSYETLYYYD